VTKSCPYSYVFPLIPSRNRVTIWFSSLSVQASNLRVGDSNPSRRASLGLRIRFAEAARRAGAGGGTWKCVASHVGERLAAAGQLLDSDSLQPSRIGPFERSRAGSGGVTVGLPHAVPGAGPPARVRAPRADEPRAGQRHDLAYPAVASPATRQCTASVSGGRARPRTRLAVTPRVAPLRSAPGTPPRSASRHRSAYPCWRRGCCGCRPPSADRSPWRARARAAAAPWHRRTRDRSRGPGR